MSTASYECPRLSGYDIHKPRKIGVNRHMYIRKNKTLGDKQNKNMFVHVHVSGENF